MSKGTKFAKNSKRLKSRLKFKVEKKVREHNRKIRKENKKKPKTWVNKARKDPGVPNVCPFKEEVLNEAQDYKQKMAEFKEKKREEMKKLRKEGRSHEMDKKKTLENIVNDATEKQETYNQENILQEVVKGYSGVTDRSAKAYYKEFRKVIEEADVVLEVLDARDPLGSRCTEVEKAVLDAGAHKRLVLVLNKVDLIPKENLETWLKHLRNELPTVAFKASTQTQNRRIGRAKFSKWSGTAKTSKCVGAETMMALLANYCRRREIKTAIRVGVVGLPNVGKSSIINSLKRKKACIVGATPGVTKSVQEISLDHNIKLLDSPGVVLADGNSNDSSVALRNAVRIEKLEDPVTPCEAILLRCGSKNMMLQYSVAQFSTVTEFLMLLAVSRGRLKKGGLPDIESAARLVLKDWNTGKIKYYTHPPEMTETHISSSLVSKFSQEFDINDIQTMETDEFAALKHATESNTHMVETSGLIENSKVVKEDDNESESDMEEGDALEDVTTENILPAKLTIVPEKKKKKKGEKENVESDPIFSLQGNQKLKKLQKMREKKKKKDMHRKERLGQELADDMDIAFSSLKPDSDNYSFETDFKMDS